MQKIHENRCPTNINDFTVFVASYIYTQHIYLGRNYPQTMTMYFSMCIYSVYIIYYELLLHYPKCQSKLLSLKITN